ncbi:MAG: biotin transporter BioY [Lachnospiraceae bacterium]|nr:biotin transporter BioY [Lachnospiraceae bacterium]
MSNTTEEKKRFEVRDLAMMGICVAFIAMCAFISIPTAVPFTLQTFAIFFVLLILGGKKGLITIVTYILLGAIGIPVFAGFKGGLGALFGLTGGYIMGFILTAIIYLILTFKEDTKLWIKIMALVIGLIVCYLYGTLWFVHIYTKSTGAIGFTQALMTCVVPFIPFDAIKLVAAVLISGRVKKIIEKEQN